MQSPQHNLPYPRPQKQESELRSCVYYPESMMDFKAPIHDRSPMFHIMDQTLLPHPTCSPSTPATQTQNAQTLKSVTLYSTCSTDTSATIRQYLTFTHRASKTSPSEISNPFDYIFLLNANAPMQGFEDICSLLHLRKKLGRDDDGGISAEQLVKSWLMFPEIDPGDPDSEDAKWLLVFEGVEDMEDLVRWWPGGGKGVVILTTGNEAFLRDGRWRNSVGFDLGQASGCGLVMR